MKWLFVLLLVPVMCFSQFGVNLLLESDFENGTFWISRYWWGDCTCNAEDRGFHKDNCMLIRDNFHYKPTGFGIQWYKYPLRDSYKSDDISLRKFREIIDQCVRSLAGEKDAKD